jgi:hypothetical protein
MFGIVFIVIIVLAWSGLFHRSKAVLQRIQKTFTKIPRQKQKKATLKYRRNLWFVKFTKIVAPKLAWIFGSFILGIVSGSGIVPFIILIGFWLVYPDKYKRPVDPQLRKLDEWIIIANQTILNK